MRSPARIFTTAQDRSSADTAVCEAAVPAAIDPFRRVAHDRYDGAVGHRSQTMERGQTHSTSLHEKLRMDFAARCDLRGREEATRMDDDNQDDLTRGLFALLTDKLDAASVTAANGQRSGLDAELATGLAQQLHTVGHDVKLLADVIIAMVSRSC